VRREADSLLDYLNGSMRTHIYYYICVLILLRVCHPVGESDGVPEGLWQLQTSMLLTKPLCCLLHLLHQVRQDLIACLMVFGTCMLCVLLDAELTPGTQFTSFTVT
jgi:hypothetical protein